MNYNDFLKKRKKRMTGGSLTTDDAALAAASVELQRMAGDLQTKVDTNYPLCMAGTPSNYFDQLMGGLLSGVSAVLYGADAVVELVEFPFDMGVAFTDPSAPGNLNGTTS